MILANFGQILANVGQMFRTIWGQTCSERSERPARSERSEHEHCSGTTQGGSPNGEYGGRPFPWHAFYLGAMAAEVVGLVWLVESRGLAHRSEDWPREVRGWAGQDLSIKVRSWEPRLAQGLLIKVMGLGNGLAGPAWSGMDQPLADTAQRGPAWNIPAKARFQEGANLFSMVLLC